MMVKFAPHEVPIAFSMIQTARKLDIQEEWYHPYHLYFYYWAAFNNIYVTIAFTDENLVELDFDSDGNVKTRENGNVRIPITKTMIGERKQIELAFQEFDDELKHNLIVHPSTDFFMRRTPQWNYQSIETDKTGQRLNGVLNVNYTTSIEYPVWSPIDIQIYAEYLENNENIEARNFLANQIVKMLYTIRCNLMHGMKNMDDRNDVGVVMSALPLLEMIVFAFMQV